MTTEKLGVSLEEEKPLEIQIEDNDPPELAIEQTPEVRVGEPVEIEIEEEPAPAPKEAPRDPGPDFDAISRRLEDAERRAAERERALQERDERLAQEQSRREQAEAHALRAAHMAEAQRFDKLRAQGQSIVNAISAEKAEMEMLKRQLAVARQSQDFDTETEVGVKLGEIGARIQSLKEGQHAIEAEIKRGPRLPAASQAQRAPAPPPQQAAPKENLTPEQVAERWMSELSPRQQAYIRNRDRSWVMDSNANLRLQAAYKLAVADGFTVDSDAFFEKIDDVMGHKLKSDPKPAAPAAPRPKAAPAAPVTHKAATNSGANMRSIPLSPREQQAAKDMGLSNHEYARRKYEMSKPSWGGPKFGQSK